jgi:hypothetical protein
MQKTYDRIEAIPALGQGTYTIAFDARMYPVKPSIISTRITACELNGDIISADLDNISNGVITCYCDPVRVSPFRTKIAVDKIIADIVSFCTPAPA